MSNVNIEERLKRLTHEPPVGCYELLHNTAFAKDDGCVYLRGAGVEGADISLCEYCAKQCKERCSIDYSDVPADQFADYMDCDCPICWLYIIAVGAAEMRIKLMRYENKECNADETCKTS